MPVLHTAIFKPRFYMLESCSTTDDTSEKTDFICTSVLSVRSHAVRVFIYLAEMVSRPLAQYWIQLLPSRPGVPNTNSTRDNHATILLYDSQTEVRSLAVTAVTALIASSKTFIQNSFIVSKQTSAAFTPSSSRLLNCCRALFSVLSSVVPKESNGVIVAKLGRLTAQLFSAMPTPAMTAPSVQALLQSLLRRALDQTGTDMTSRAACASALANALSCSVSILEPNFLTWVSSQISGSLHPNQPVAELLVAFRSLVHMRCDFFSCVWITIKGHLQDMNATSEVALHKVRVFSTFLTSCLQDQQSSAKGDDIAEYVPLVVDVYHTLVKSSIESYDRVLRTCAVAVVQSLFQCHAVNVSFDPPHNRDEDIDTLAKDAAHKMKHFIMLWDGQVLAACVQAIAYAHLEVEPNFAEDTLALICNVLEHPENSGAQVTKFCMSSMTRMMENLIKQFPHLVTDDVLHIITKGNNFAIKVLRESSGLRAASAVKSSSDRASEEANKTAAVGLIACNIIVQKSLEQKSFSSKEFPLEIESGIQLLRQLLESNTESLNLRCCACRALGRVVIFQSGGLGENIDAVLRDMIATMSPMNNVRLQICSASSMIQIMKCSKTEDTLSAILQNSISCYLAVMTLAKSGGLAPKLRSQLSTLQNLIRELIFTVFQRASKKFLAEVKSKWDPHWEPKILIACISSYLSLPKYVTYESEGDSDKVVQSLSVAQRDVMHIILQLISSLRKVEPDVSG